ncbi:hypothetical protein VSS37_21455 [Candidatus Thiothrix sp. Deng01]|uniref:Uncharacterized protein n=1 Tax=Candidatus Thiothrix phosphatis TaxID=3112415 RepID=A0ABU6D396_9GAMM|nr:hypothetical protein [Candidatus Thiothrix sp. Deng01]MEB4593559.1 hypothetical protein [Candidatus Thiothrix sp. Deng01]
MNNKQLVFQRFPDSLSGGKSSANENPAIYLYGKRFYKDQTPVEYLAEFLLVFSSPKSRSVLGDDEIIYRGMFEFDLDKAEPRYYPENKVALKLFSFFSNSKLETRHPAHYKAYIDSLIRLSDKIDGDVSHKKEAIQLLQSLFNGFVGVSNNRTWVTHCFLPASTSLLSREVDWLHTGKSGAKNKDLEWNFGNNQSEITNYFVHDRHNFMARGGESIFLQLVNLFDNINHEDLKNLQEDIHYYHLKPLSKNIQKNIENGLSALLFNGTGSLNYIVDFVDNTLNGYDIDSSPATLGWVPTSTRVEALLFAIEIENLCTSDLGSMEKLDLLKTLCCMQVLRTHCFQASRLDSVESFTDGFAGNYVWVAASEGAPANDSLRKIAQESFRKIDNVLYRVLRHEVLPNPKDYKEATKHGYDIFKKLAKEIGLVIPRQGQGARFVLHQGLLRFLVAALIRPGERIRLNQFYQRIFAHYGIAIGGDQLKVALQWIGKEEDSDTYAVASSSAWVEEALKQGGFLVELSDAVSMVMNPGEGQTS